MRTRFAPIIALFACAIASAGCEVASAVRAPRPTGADPFNYHVAVGPSRFNIEGYLVRTSFPGARPALLVLLGRGLDAARCVGYGRAIAAEGIHVACVSIPGYGRSSGPSRFVGRQALAAARAALDQLERRPDVDPNRLAVWGVSEGAVAAGLLMDFDPRPRTVVLQSGAYDTLNLWSEAPLTTKLAILREVWPSRRLMRQRSVIDHLPPRLDATVLILHGMRDARIPVVQARRLEHALRARGARVFSRYFPDGRHDLGPDAAASAARFVRSQFMAGEARVAY
jgi:dienelactone hydrolase